MQPLFLLNEMSASQGQGWASSELPTCQSSICTPARVLLCTAVHPRAAVTLLQLWPLEVKGTRQEQRESGVAKWFLPLNAKRSKLSGIPALKWPCLINTK